MLQSITGDHAEAGISPEMEPYLASFLSLACSFVFLSLGPSLVHLRVRFWGPQTKTESSCQRRRSKKERKLIFIYTAVFFPHPALSALHVLTHWILLKGNA